MNDKHSSFFDYKFDFDNYINKRIQEIEDVEERRFAKNLLMEGFGNVIKSYETKYKNLQECIYKEGDTKDFYYEINIKLINKKNYNQDNKTYFPVCLNDISNDIEDTDKSCLLIETIYLELSQRECAKFEQEVNRLGCLINRYDSKPLNIMIRPAIRYRQAVEWLYGLYQANKIPWRTVNMGHFDKFYDIFLSKSETRHEISLADIVIDWGHYEPAICHNLMPVWNVSLKLFSSIDYKATDFGKKYYVHEIIIDNLAILIEPNPDIIEISREGDCIKLNSSEDIFENWVLVQIINDVDTVAVNSEYPILKNSKKSTFFRQLAAKKNHFITKAELNRMFYELEIFDYIQFIGYEIQGTYHILQYKTNMNWFVQDELFPLETRKVLLLKFKENKQGYYLNDSIMNFAVSELQLEINEYRCVGVIV